MAINLGPVKPYVKTVADQLAALFHITNAGGWRATDQFPDHPSGHAVDFMVDNLGKGGDARTNPVAKSTGDALAEYITQNAEALGVKYIIWNGRSWNAQRGTWEKYKATDNMHYDHVHVTWNDVPGTAIGNIPQLQNVGNGLTGVDLTKVFDKVNSTAITMSVALLGLGLVGAGIWLAVSPKVAKTVNSAVKTIPGL